MCVHVCVCVCVCRVKCLVVHEGVRAHRSKFLELVEAIHMQPVPGMCHNRYWVRDREYAMRHAWQPFSEKACQIVLADDRHWRTDA